MPGDKAQLDPASALADSMSATWIRVLCFFGASIIGHALGLTVAGVTWGAGDFALAALTWVVVLFGDYRSLILLPLHLFLGVALVFTDWRRAPLLCTLVLAQFWGTIAMVAHRHNMEAGWRLFLVAGLLSLPFVLIGFWPWLPLVGRRRDGH